MPLCDPPPTLLSWTRISDAVDRRASLSAVEGACLHGRAERTAGAARGVQPATAPDGTALVDARRRPTPRSISPSNGVLIQATRRRRKSFSSAISAAWESSRGRTTTSTAWRARRVHVLFALESGQAVPIAGEHVRQDLQRDVAFEPRVARAIHFAHAAGPNRPDRRRRRRSSCRSRETSGWARIIAAAPRLPPYDPRSLTVRRRIHLLKNGERS